jgi:hypothetical protein
MDMIVIDKNGKYWGYDMKAKRSGVKAEDRVNYGNQLGLYDAILSPYGISFEGTSLIHSSVMYDAPAVMDNVAKEWVKVDDVDYEVKDGQLYENGTPIQEVKSYRAPRLAFTEDEVGDNTLIPVTKDNTKKMQIELDSLPKEDKALAEEEFGSKFEKLKEEGSSIKYGKNKKSEAKSGLYNPLLSASERRFLANQVMQRLSFIITHLQTSREANNYYFPDGRFAGNDFTKMEREDIIKTVTIQALFNVVKEKVFLVALANANSELVSQKLQIAYDNFNDLIDEGYSKLISLEGVPVVRIAESEGVITDTGDDNNITDNEASTLEDKQREYWQLGQRQISAKSSLSKEIRRMFERLEVRDENGNPIADKYGFGMGTFVDSDTAVNSILDWVKNCSTMEEMDEILLRKAPSNPWLYGIISKITEEPMRSLFFKNFRKDFTTYSVVQKDIDKETGNTVFKVHVINTSSAEDTILKNISTRFNIGDMPNLIKSKDTIEGKGTVNVEKVTALRKEVLRITTKIVKAQNESRVKLQKAIKDETINITNLLNDIGINILDKTLSEVITKGIDKSNKGSNVISILNKASYILDTIYDNRNNTAYNPIQKGLQAGNVYSTYRALVQIVAPQIQASIEASVYENGKMYYSFVTPSYMGKLITDLKGAIESDIDTKEGKQTKFQRYLEENFKGYRWFYEGEECNLDWLDKLQHSKKAREVLDHKVQLNFGKTAYQDLSELGYTLSLMHEYFYDPDKKYAWYRVPMLSNKPSSEFIKFYRYTGDDYKRNIKLGLQKVFNQEVLRIQTVLERLVTDNDISKIANYDINKALLEANLSKKELTALYKRIKTKSITTSDLATIKRIMSSKKGSSGAEFRFLDALNNEIIDNTDLGKLIVGQINGKLSNSEKVLLSEQLIGSDNGRKGNGAFGDYMDAIVASEMAKWESIGLFEEVEREIDGKNGKETKTYFKYANQFGKTREELEANLENYIWNDMFATINIIELTATDIAYYKNMEDFQKRFAEVHSPTMKLNTEATYKGRKVSDGYARTIYIKDNEVKSEIIPNVRAIFDKKIATIKDPRKKAEMQKMADLIISGFEKVNVTDAQAYSCPTSYRKKMIMAGKWSDIEEQAYNRIRSGDFDVNDLGVVWQPLKPFVYSQIRKSTGVSSMSEIKMGVQNKNSEYMLLIADALMRGAGMESKLGAIFDFMEATHKERDSKGNIIEDSYVEDGIDTVQFESAVKVGLMGVIDINQNEDGTPITKKQIVEKLNNAVYYNKNKKPSEDNNMDKYNDQFVHAIPYEDYGIQQEVPAHLEGMQAMGSQIRILSVSDISEGVTFKVGKQSKEYSRDELIHHYQELQARNIREAYDKLASDLNLNGTRKEINKALSDILTDAIKKDQRYGSDLLRACKLDKNGEFIIPPCDPIQSRRIQELINSIVKSRINKQQVQGGPVVQASTFGTSKDLHIVFNDKNGNPLRFKRENESDEEYQKYVTENQASLAYMEVYMSVPSKSLEEKLVDKDGHMMDIQEAIDNNIISKEEAEEMFKAIGYRIPTEDKYSMIPMKIVGFLPKAAGEAVMMPKEITLLTGSDFDIDKMYIMLKEFTIQKDLDKFSKNIGNSYAKKFKDNYKGAEAQKRLKKIKEEVIPTWIKELDKNGHISTTFGSEYGSAKELGFIKKMIEKFYDERAESYAQFVECNKGNLGKENKSTRNNEVFDIQWAVLTNADTLPKMFNPGSFDVQKKSAAIIKAIKAGVNKSYAELSSMKLKDIEALVPSSTGNIIFSTTQVAFHKQNMTAGKLIGIFANNNTSHAFLSMQNIHINFYDGAQFTINGYTVNDNQHNHLDEQYAIDGTTLISKTIAGFLAASVDAVKDPVLNFMNLNTVTAGPAMLLARLGFDSDTIGLIMSQPIIEEVTREYFKANNEKYTSIEDIINQTLTKADKSYDDIRALEEQSYTTNFTKEELANSLNDPAYIDSQLLVLMLFKQLSSISKDLNTLTFLTKFNSITNAAGPTIADSLALKERYEKFQEEMRGSTPRFSNNASYVIDNSPLLTAFYESTVGNQGIPSRLFKKYFPHYTATFGFILDRLRKTTRGTISADTINKLANDFILYKLTAGSNPIINTSFEQRNRFINNFPKEFKKRAEGLVSNELIQLISTEASTYKCPAPTLTTRVGGLNADQQETIKAAWSSLMEDPETFDLGRDLFLYNLYRNGFSYSPKTFLHLASVDTKLAMGNYVETVANPTFNDDIISINDFLLQFRRNRYNDRQLVPEFVKPKEGSTTKARKDGDKLIITYESKRLDLSSIVVEKGDTSTTFVPVIMYDNNLYYARANEISIGLNKIVYSKIKPLGNTNNFLEYNAREGGMEMESVLDSSSSGFEKINEDYDESGDSKEDTSDDVNHDSKEPTLADYKFLLNNVLAPEQAATIQELAAKEGDEEATSLMLKLVNKTIKTDKNLSESIKKQAKEIIKKFCKR